MHLFALLGLALIAIGVGLIYMPAGVIAGGAALVVIDRFGIDVLDEEPKS